MTTTNLRKKLKFWWSFFACAMLLLWITSSCSVKGHPTDQALTSNFQTHKADFVKLLAMFVTDKKLGRVAYDFTRPEKPESVGVSQKRLDEYRRLFDALALSEGVEGYGAKDTIWFHASTQGLSVTGSAKGYVYLKHKPALLVADLDTYEAKDGHSFTAYKHLEGNWYLYLDYED